MIKARYIIFILLLSACGGSDMETSTDPEKVNQSPTTPELAYPTQNSLCVENELTFSWDSSIDTDGDAITYQIQISEDESFVTVIHDLVTAEISSNQGLDKGQTYYWRVRAIDNKGNESVFSSTWKFYTQSDLTLNRLPFLPFAVSPEDGEEINGDSISLVWNSWDADGDILTYDIYFSEDFDSSALLLADYEENSFLVSLNPNSTYTWKIVVKDSKGGVAIGPEWHFRTL